MNVLYKADNTSVILKVFIKNIFTVTQVLKLNIYSRIKECLLTKSSFQNIKLINCSFFKYFRISLKNYLCAFFCAFSNYL